MKVLKIHIQSLITSCPNSKLSDFSDYLVLTYIEIKPIYFLMTFCYYVIEQLPVMLLVAKNKFMNSM